MSEFDQPGEGASRPASSATPRKLGQTAAGVARGNYVTRNLDAESGPWTGYFVLEQHRLAAAAALVRSAHHVAEADRRMQYSPQIMDSLEVGLKRVGNERAAHSVRSGAAIAFELLEAAVSGFRGGNQEVRDAAGPWWLIDNEEALNLPARQVHLDTRRSLLRAQRESGADTVTAIVNEVLTASGLGEQFDVAVSNVEPSGTQPISLPEARLGAAFVVLGAAGLF